MTSSSPESRHFPTHSAATAPEAARPFLAAQEAAFGFVPLPSARHATAPGVVAAFTQLLDLFEHSSLAPMEREALALALAGRFDCVVCRALHGGIARKLGASPELVAALVARSNVPDDRLAEVVRFLDDVVDTQGKVTNASLDRFFTAGFDSRQALEVVLGVATYTLSIFANRMTRSETLR
jgi:AhpD family alkylhydroperoxidase